MTDPPRHPDAGERTDDTGVPRWVKVLGIIALLVVLLFGVMMLTGVVGGGGHTPRRHGGAGGDAPPSSITQDVIPDGGHTGPPAGGH